MSMFRATLALLAFSTTAQAATVKPTSLQASSYLERDGEYFEAKNLADGKADKAWFEGADGSGLNSWITISVPAGTQVSGLKIWNGYWITPTYWGRYNRAKEIEVQIDTGDVHKFTLKDEMSPEIIRLASPVSGSAIKIKIKGVHKGNTYNDTGFSEIQVLDSGPSTSFEPVASTSSSDLGPEYSPAGLSDGLKDTMWCEGNKESDGSGEWFELDFGKEQIVSKLQLINGVGTSGRDFLNANHATSIKLDFSDGSSWTGAPKGLPLVHTLDFPMKRSSKVRVTISGVKKGKKYNDLCISEAAFLR